MPRANRYLVPGYICHVTHRCHNRSYLFKFARDREEYRKRLRQSLPCYGVELLTYTITSNHTHLLLHAETTDCLSGLEAGSDLEIGVSNGEAGSDLEIGVSKADGL